MLNKFFNLILLILISSCASTSNNYNPHDILKKGRVYSQPDWNEPSSAKLPPQIKRIVLIGTNDFHGNLEAIKKKSLF